MRTLVPGTPPGTGTRYQVPSYIPVILDDKHEINQASLLSLTANKSSSLDPKTPFTMPEPNNNIFLTTENLAFSMPLILVCSLYVSEAIKQMLFEPIKLLVPDYLVVMVSFFENRARNGYF